MNSNQLIKNKVYEYLQTIPRGRVVTYGQIAEYLGNKNMSRAVGNILHNNPDPVKYPCYKVVDRNGRLSAHFGFGGVEKQKELLEKDGIEVKDYKVDLSRYGFLNGYICKIANSEEMNIKWDYEIEHHSEDRENWVIWKKQSIENFKNGDTIPYYGILDGKIICEATAMLNPQSVQNSEGLVGTDVVYLSAFRTVNEYRGKGYFSVLLKFMLEDLKKRGYVKATLGVEPSEKDNKSIYEHFGFTDYIKSAKEEYPDGTVIDVDYYGKNLLPPRR